APGSPPAQRPVWPPGPAVDDPPGSPPPRPRCRRVVAECGSTPTCSPVRVPAHGHQLPAQPTWQSQARIPAMPLRRPTRRPTTATHADGQPRPAAATPDTPPPAQPALTMPSRTHSMTACCWVSITDDHPKNANTLSPLVLANLRADSW